MESSATFELNSQLRAQKQELEAERMERLKLEERTDGLQEKLDEAEKKLKERGKCSHCALRVFFFIPCIPLKSAVHILKASYYQTGCRKL